MTTTPAPAPRPLLHCLINALNLYDQQTLPVAAALKAHPQQLTTPADLETVLQPLLTAKQAAQLHALELSGDLMPQLHLLAVVR